MKAKIKQILKRIFLTHIGRILLGMILCVVGGILSPMGTIGELIYDYDKGIFWSWMLYIGTAIWVGEALLFIVHGLIINPIRNLINKFKK